MPRAISCELLSLLLRRPFGAGPAEQALELATHFEHKQLITRVDIGDEDALARQNGDQSLASKSLQGFSNRSAANIERRREHLFRQHLARLEAQGYDLLFNAR